MRRHTARRCEGACHTQRQRVSVHDEGLARRKLARPSESTDADAGAGQEAGGASLPSVRPTLIVQLHYVKPSLRTTPAGFADDVRATPGMM